MADTFVSAIFSLSKKSVFQSVGGGALDAPAVKPCSFCLFGRIHNFYERAVEGASPYNWFFGTLKMADTFVSAISL
jgi:hypothetical protein